MEAATLPQEPPGKLEPVYRLREMATSLKVCERTLERLIHRGGFPGPDRCIGKVRLWKASTIARWLNQPQEKAAS